MVTGTTVRRYLTRYRVTDMLSAMGKTTSERQQAFRAKRIQEGYKRFQVWAHPADWPVIKRLAERLMKRRAAK